MYLQEFAALRPGDEIVNPMNPGSRGRIIEATDSGVRLCWLGSETRFFYSVNSMAWTHWSVAQPEQTHD